jgi:hypothetical protein
MGSATSTFVTTTTGVGVGVGVDFATSPAGSATPVGDPDAHDTVVNTVAASAMPKTIDRTRGCVTEAP